MYPESLSRLISELSRLPGVGQKTAERLAYHILKATSDEAMRLAIAIRDVKKNIRPCSVCAMVTEGDPCSICADATRDAAMICVVEQPKDVYALEKARSYRGVYHVLMGNMALLDGIEPKDLTIDLLEARVRKGTVREVILATNPNLEGDATSLYLSKLLGPLGVRVTRIARGIPAGSTLEYASKSILEDALEGRRDIPSA
jgi:recombination protein RecR